MDVSNDAMLRVIDRQEIEDLPKKYAHGIDNRDWASVDACFSTTAEVHGTQFSGPYPEYIRNLRGAVEQFRTTMHFFGNQLTEVHGDAGKVDTQGIAFHLGSSATEDFVIGVQYLDDVTRVEGQWQITGRRIRGIWRRPFAGEIDDLT